MQLKTSYFNRTLFQKNLSRFWPLWVVYTAIWAVMMPLLQFTYSRGGNFSFAFSLQNFQEYTLEMATGSAAVMALIFGALFAMAGFSYLCNPRSVGMMHSFPIRREGIFCSNFLAGLFMQISGLAAVCALTVLVQATSGVGVAWKELLLWLAVNAGLTLFFYSFAVFCAMFTGQILAIPVFYAIWNVLVVGVEFLVRNFATAFLYGATGGGISRAAEWCSPIVKLLQGLDVDQVYGQEGIDPTVVEVTLHGTSAVWVYAAVGVVLAVAALALYRLRRSESAGDTVSVSWAKPLFTYGVAICAALGLGQLLYNITWDQFAPHQSSGLPAMLACMLLTGLVGYFGAEMLLRKSFRVLKTAWKGAVGLTVAVVLFGVGLSVDLIGFESHVPMTEQVDSVTLHIGGYRYLRVDTQDAALIARIEAVHQAIVDEKEIQKSRAMDGTVASLMVEDAANAGADAAVRNWVSVDISYWLKNGNAVRRSYVLRYTPEEVAQPQSAAGQLAALYTDPDIQRNSVLGSHTADRVTGGDFGYYANSAEYGRGWQNYPLTSEEGRALFAAVEEDIAAGRMGKGVLFNGGAELIAYNNGLQLYCRPQGSDGTAYLNVNLTTYCTSTIAALKELGIVTAERQLLTEAETYRLENPEETTTTMLPELPVDAALQPGVSPDVPEWGEATRQGTIATDILQKSTV